MHFLRVWNAYLVNSGVLTLALSNSVVCIHLDVWFIFFSLLNPSVLFSSLISIHLYISLGFVLSGLFPCNSLLKLAKSCILFFQDVWVC